MQVIVLTPEELKSIIADAVAQGVRQGVMEAKPLLQKEDYVRMERAMELCGFKDADSFRKWCKANGIEPEKKASKNFYLPSQLRAAHVRKGARQL